MAQHYSIKLVIAFAAVGWIVLSWMATEYATTLKSEPKRLAAVTCMFIASCFMLLAFLVPLMASQQCWF